MGTTPSSNVRSDTVATVLRVPIFASSRLRVPPRRSALKLFYPLGLLLVAGCSGPLPRTDVTSSQPLPNRVTVTAGRLASATGCPLNYQIYRIAAPPEGGDWVILAPGFLRGQGHLRDLAATLARDGMQVATLDFCNQKPWAGRHVQNARDMHALARHLGAERVVYAGFSAGGLAALLAARADPKALGVVTLDLVEAQGLGLRAARGLDKPLLALAGEPTNCNAQGNSDAVYAIAGLARVQRIAGAGHCDFESPSDALCELVCTDPDGPERSHRRQIIARAAAALQSLLPGVASPGRKPQTNPADPRSVHGACSVSPSALTATRTT